MNRFRKLTITLAVICVLALSALALIRKSPAKPEPNPGDVIIIKGGSLEIQCPDSDACLGAADANGKYRHKKSTSHITQIVVKDINGSTVLYTGTFDATHQPQIEVTYK